MNNLPTLIGRNRLAIWREKPTDAQRTAIVDHVAGAVIAEHLMIGDVLFARTNLEARDLAMRAGLGANVRFVRGVIQAQTGARFDIGPAQQTPPRNAPRFSQLGDGMFVIEVNQPSREGRAAAKDLYVLGVAEVKLASQVGELPAQLSKTRERLEGLGIRVGNDVYIPAEHAKPGQNRLFTAADLGARTRWIVAAPRDARKSAAGWSTLQRTSDRAVGQPVGSVRVIRLPVPNAAIRKYSEHLLDILTER